MKSLGSILLPLVLLPSILAVSCQDEAKRMGKGFRLPQGSIEKGQTAFLDMKCNQCHSIAGTALPKPDAASPISHELGGEVRKLKSYGELVTAIIRPEHIDSPEILAKLPKAPDGKPISPMPSFNDTMTVTQLTDIVTFLHSHYLKAPPPGLQYPKYSP